MAEIFLYADETGNLDYEGESKRGASTYFGFGTATFDGQHAEALFGGMKLRAEISSSGIELAKGFHAVDDKIQTKNRVFQLVGEQAPRFDATFLYKAGAYPSVKERGQEYLYKMAWYLHIKEVALHVANKNDTLYVIAGTMGTAARRTAARLALADVCNQIDRDIKLCVWDAATSWGLQVADYGLWAMQRVLEGKTCSWYEPCVKPTVATNFRPWGRKPF